jgi:hypothetical protein
MRNFRSLLILILITGLAVLAALYWSRDSGDTTAARSEAVLPGLAERAGATTEVNLLSGDLALTLARAESGWGLRERDDYPVRTDRVRALITGLVALTRLEAKTRKAENHAALDLAAAGPGSGARQIGLADEKGDAIAEIIVGKRQPSRGDSRLDEIYVRTPDDPQVWLAEGRLPDWQGVADWLQTEVSDIDRGRVRRVDVRHRDGNRISVARADATTSDFALLDLAETENAKSSADVEALATAFGGLALEEVRRDADLPADLEAEIEARMTTFDGLVIELSLLAFDGTRWARLTASHEPPAESTAAQADTQADTEANPVGDPDQTDEAEPGEPPDPEADAETLNQRWAGWLYKLPDYRLDSLSRPRSDLVDTAEATEQTGTTQATDTGN